MNEREQALQIALDWLDFRMDAFVQMVPGDPDCDACVLARQFVRLSDALQVLTNALDESVKLQSHYAEILNDIDGGRRMQFADHEAWMNRIMNLKMAPPEG